MKIKTEIRVMNNASLSLDHIAVETTCAGSLSIMVPVSRLGHGPTINGCTEIELDRVQLREFLARTMPAFTVTGEYYDAGQSH